jgi:hypothetical protein
VRGDRRITAAALGTVLALGLAVAALVSAAGGRSATSLVTLEVAPRGPGSISTDTPGFDLDAGNDTTPISGPCTNNEGEGECRWGFARGTPVKLTANPNGDRFNGWSTPTCPGTGSCTVTVDDDVTTIVGQFNPLTLGVKLSSNDVGTVTSNPTGINCSSDGDDGCLHGFKANTPVQLTVTGGDFRGWKGNCVPADQRTCTIVVDDERTWAGVTFDDDTPPTLDTTISVLLQVKKLGGGGGTVTATDIDCGTQCTRRLTFGAAVTLTAQPDKKSTFDGWGGLCAQKQLTCEFPAGPITGVDVKFGQTRLASRLAGVVVHRSGSKRTVAVQLRVNRTTTALLALRRHGRKVAHARYAVHHGTNRLRLPVRRSVAAGRCRLGVTVLDPDGGTPQVFSRGIRLPKSR